MHAIWRGTISFGLVSIPVKLYSATEEKGVSFRQVHGADGGRIRYRRVCSVDGQEVPYPEIAKGYEMPDGEVVVLTDDDFAALPLPTQRTIEVLQFVPAEQVDALYLSKGYYLGAEGPGVRPYLLLREALERAGRIAVVKVALRNRESLAVLRSREGALLVQTMLWPDEIRDAAPFAPGEDIEVRDQEIAMAESYIQTLSEDFDPAAFTDDYRTALEELVQAKAGGRELEEPAPAEAPGAVLDLMAALRASVEAARERRAGGASAPAAAPEPAPARRTTARKKAASPAAAEEEPAAPARTATTRKKAAAAKTTSKTATKTATPAAKRGTKPAARKSA